jgi:hypothetical protein
VSLGAQPSLLKVNITPVTLLLHGFCQGGRKACVHMRHSRCVCNSQNPSADEWTSKMWCSHALVCRPTIKSRLLIKPTVWMSVKVMMTSGRNCCHLDLKCPQRPCVKRLGLQPATIGKEQKPKSRAHWEVFKSLGWVLEGNFGTCPFHFHKADLNFASLHILHHDVLPCHGPQSNRTNPAWAAASETVIHGKPFLLLR